MAKKINLDREELVEISGAGMILEVRKDAPGSVCVRVESDLGGRRIYIKQHPDDARTIVYSFGESPPEGSGNSSRLSLVK